MVMLIYNLIKYSDNYSKAPGSLWQYNRDEAALNDNGFIIDFGADNESASFNFKQEIIDQTGNDGTREMFK